MPKILDLAYAAVLVGGGFQGVLSRWAGVGSAVVVLALGAKLKSVVSLVLTLALSRRWGALGTTYATAVPAVLTAVMAFLYATQKKTMKARKMAPMVEEPTLDYTSKLVDSTVKGWGYSKVKFEQDHSDHSVRLVGDAHYPDLSGKRIPHLISFVCEMTGISLEEFNMEPQGDATVECFQDRVAGTNPLSAAAKAALAGAFPSREGLPDQLEYDEHSRQERSRGGYFAYVIPTNVRVVDCVVYPESVEEVEAVVALAKQHDVALIPRGGGTNVSNMLEVPATEPRPFISLDMTRMTKLLWLDDVNLVAEIEAGANGRLVEQQLNAEGYTMGHEPDSYEFSTIGGWVSTNASGMKRTRYGNIEDIVLDTKLVTVAGRHSKKVQTARYSHGPDVQQMLYGSEGNFGVITSVVVKVHALPEQQDYDSFVFKSWQAGVAFLRESYLAGCTPAACRLVDNEQFRFGHALKPEKKGAKEILKSKVQTFAVTKLYGFDPNSLVAATMKFEGSQLQVASQKDLITKIAARHGGVSGGAEGGRTGYNVTMAIAYIGDFMAQHNIIGETFETSCPWDRIDAVISGAKAEVLRQHKIHFGPDGNGVKGNGFISSRVTQQYHSGVCIYFTYGYWHGGQSGAAAKFEEIYFELKRAVVAAGGSVSHHHGIGKLRKPFIEDGTLWDEQAIAAVRAFKHSIDPDNVFAASNNFCGKAVPH